MLFVFNDTEDRDRASDGVSRYGAYLRDHAEEFRTLFDQIDDRAVTRDPGEFAAAAWKVATSPIMAPPYLGWTAERLISVSFSAGWESWLIAEVQVAVPRPQVLRDVAAGFTDWARPSYPGGTYEGPSGAYMDRPALLTSAELAWRIDFADLYVPQDAPGRLSVADAKLSVKRLAWLLEARLAPVMAALSDSAGVA
jgi:hypothetical protein